jgi:hypothetical protein
LAVAAFIAAFRKAVCLFGVTLPATAPFTWLRSSRHFAIFANFQDWLGK